ncbi:MAG: hypothetical protein U0L72_05955 [Acutalibacteraceae bacterium]|nr:hypothetical protein [Acutalibacteraceae bacterium]
MQKSIFSEIKSGYDYLTKTEKKIADVIISNPLEFTKISITQLSELAEVSQGSINNFSKKFCGGGFENRTNFLLQNCFAPKKDKFLVG